MSPRSFLLDDRLNTYVLAHTVPADPVIARLTEREQRPFWQRALYFILVGPAILLALWAQFRVKCLQIGQPMS